MAFAFVDVGAILFEGSVCNGKVTRRSVVIFEGKALRKSPRGSSRSLLWLSIVIVRAKSGRSLDSSPD